MHGLLPEPDAVLGRNGRFELGEILLAGQQQRFGGGVVGVVESKTFAGDLNDLGEVPETVEDVCRVIVSRWKVSDASKAELVAGFLELIVDVVASFLSPNFSRYVREVEAVELLKHSASHAKTWLSLFMRAV